MPRSVCFLLFTALIAGCAGPHIAGVTLSGAKCAVSKTDVREAIAAGENFGGRWGRSARFRVTAVDVTDHSHMRLLQKPNDGIWVYVTRENGKWKYDTFGYNDW